MDKKYFESPKFLQHILIGAAAVTAFLWIMKKREESEEESK
jgi:hypothetical protein